MGTGKNATFPGLGDCSILFALQRYDPTSIVLMSLRNAVSRALLITLSICLFSDRGERTAANAQAALTPAAEQIRTLVEIATPASGYFIQEEKLHAERALPDFYRRREYRPGIKTRLG